MVSISFYRAMFRLFWKISVKILDNIYIMDCTKIGNFAKFRTFLFCREEIKDM